MELWLVRHGTSIANIENRIQGRLDFPLSQLGREEALCLAGRLKNQPFSFLFSSPLARARETAEIIASQRKRKQPTPVLLPLIQEYCWGVLQGLTQEEIRQRYPGLGKQLQQDFHHTRVPGAEGLHNLFRRVKFFYRLLSWLEQRGRCPLPLLVVSHGRFLQAFVLFFLGFNREEFWPFSFKPASLTVLEGDFQKRRRLKLFNDTCHLDHIGNEKGNTWIN